MCYLTTGPKAMGPTNHRLKSPKQWDKIKLSLFDSLGVWAQDFTLVGRCSTIWATLPAQPFFLISWLSQVFVTVTET
jgi:hypothetical protein